MTQRVIFRRPREVALEDFELQPVRRGSVVVRTSCSLVSSGTELTVLNRRYEAGSHWDRWVTFPFRPGYAAVGEVTEVGPGVEDLSPGDRVVARAPHAARSVLAAHECTLVPAGVDDRDAPWFALAKIAFMGARAARHSLGDRVVVIGAGPIGQMAVRWANAAGARAVVVVDTVPGRLGLARMGGATAVVAKPAGEAIGEVIGHVGAPGPDVVIDSTGNPVVFAAALSLVRPRGRVVILGDAGAPTDQRLTGEVITKGITIVGAHDGLSPLEPDWDGDRSIHALFFHLLLTGRFALDGLTTHTFRPAECAAAYRLADERRAEALGIVFDWS